MARLKGGEILIDISYLSIIGESEQSISLGSLQSREINQILSLFILENIVDFNKIKPVRIKINYDGTIIETLLTHIEDDSSGIFGIITLDTAPKFLKIEITNSEVFLQEITLS